MVWVSDTPPGGSEFFGALSFSGSEVWVFDVWVFTTPSNKTVPPFIFKLFQINTVSALGFIVFQHGLDNVYNADKFMKQFGEFVYQNNCNLRQFGWQLSVPLTRLNLAYLTCYFMFCIVKHSLRLLNLLFFFAWGWTINFDVSIAYVRLKNDCFRMHSGSGSENVDQRSPCSREMVQLEKCLNGAFWMDSNNYWTRIKCFSERVILSVQ